MAKHNEKNLFRRIGGEEGCLQLARVFYARVANDPILKPLFPGKSLRCATEEFSAFLVQFFDGDEAQTQHRWWLSLSQSHARFKISESQKNAWLGHMYATLDSSFTGDDLRASLHSFFETVSNYIVASDRAEPANPELAELWQRQLSLDQLIESIDAGRDAEAIALVERHASRRSVVVGILARMMETGREPLIEFVLNSLEGDPELEKSRYNGRFLIHFASGFGCLPVVSYLLSQGQDPNILDHGSHTPLYRVANECGKDVGATIVHELVRSGAVVDHSAGVTRSTPLHAAARRGHLAVAKALISCGASLEAHDRKGCTPLDRARNCRKREMATVLESLMEPDSSHS